MFQHYFSLGDIFRLHSFRRFSFGRFFQQPRFLPLSPVLISKSINTLATMSVNCKEDWINLSSNVTATFGVLYQHMSLYSVVHLISLDELQLGQVHFIILKEFHFLVIIISALRFSFPITVLALGLLPVRYLICFDLTSDPTSSSLHHIL